MKEKDFSEAKARAHYLIDERPGDEEARAWYYLGESAYQQGKYEEAVDAFNQSGALDKGASHMPVLLYHSGVAYQKLGKKKQAADFFQTLRGLYPDHELSKWAKKRLEKL